MIEHSPIEYGSKWRPDRPEFFVSFDEKEAKRRHDQKIPYSILFDGNDWSDVAVYCNFQKRTAEVSFLDEFGGIQGIYFFEECEPLAEGKLFLTAANWNFKEGDNVRARFETGGVFEMWLNVSSEKIRIQGETDVESNWEVMPKFGAYEQIGRLKRGQSWDLSNHSQLLRWIENC